ncbi:amidohydrolase family protein [Hyphomonas sp.]|jgi:imidazolonepropionase-like amidohydrolase|uniref:amidohydrolase family protein n=1 Tax=Hyphomonas sp. TaxID=87 RepID=UPI0032D939C4
MIRTLLTSVAALGLATAPALAETFVICGETVWTGTAQGVIENGIVVIEDDRIVSVGGAGTEVPDGATEITAAWVTPGLIAAFSQTGLVEVDAEDSTNDTAAAMSGFSAALNAADGFNPDATAIDVTRIEGFTRLVVAPDTGNSLFAGQGFVADASGDLDTELDEKVFAFIKLGEAGAGLAGGSRQSAMTLLRAALDDARSYPARYITQNDGAVLNRVDAQALAPAARGQQLILVQASRASDLNAIMDLAEDEPSLNFVIVGADEAWRVAPRLAETGIPVIIDAFSNLPASFEKLAATSENAARLAEAGATFAIANVGDGSHQARLATQLAGNAVANGLSFDDAMIALTSAPADIFGLTGFGRLAPGAHADVVAWDGDPLEIVSSPVAVIIDGEQQSMESRQTRLRDRYLNLDESERPHAYTRP